MTALAHVGEVLHPTYADDPVVEAGHLRAAAKPVLLHVSVLVQALKRVGEKVHVAVGEDQGLELVNGDTLLRLGHHHHQHLVDDTLQTRSGQHIFLLNVLETYIYLVRI